MPSDVEGNLWTGAVSFETRRDRRGSGGRSPTQPQRHVIALAGCLRMLHRAHLSVAELHISIRWRARAPSPRIDDRASRKQGVRTATRQCGCGDSARASPSACCRSTAEDPVGRLRSRPPISVWLPYSPIGACRRREGFIADCLNIVKSLSLLERFVHFSVSVALERRHSACQLAALERMRARTSSPARIHTGELHDVPKRP
jgi:hypothetical protein